MADNTRQGPMLRAAFSRSGLRLQELWFRHLALGGNAERLELDGFLHGVMLLPRPELDVLAHVLNERLDELDEPARRSKVPYSWSAADRTE